MLTSALAPRNKGWSILKPCEVWYPQPIEPTPGMSPTQLAERMKMKILAKNQNVRSRQMRTDDAVHELVESFDQPFHKILCTCRNLLHVSCSDLRKYDET